MSKTLNDPTAISNLFGVLGCTLLAFSVAASSAFGQNPEPPPPAIDPNISSEHCEPSGVPDQENPDEKTECDCGGHCYKRAEDYTYDGCKARIAAVYNADLSFDRFDCGCTCQPSTVEESGN